MYDTCGRIFVFILLIHSNLLYLICTHLILSYSYTSWIIELRPFLFACNLILTEREKNMKAKYYLHNIYINEYKMYHHAMLVRHMRIHMDLFLATWDRKNFPSETFFFRSYVIWLNFWICNACLSRIWGMCECEMWNRINGRENVIYAYIYMCHKSEIINIILNKHNKIVPADALISDRSRIDNKTCL